MNIYLQSCQLILTLLLSLLFLRLYLILPNWTFLTRRKRNKNIFLMTFHFQLPVIAVRFELKHFFYSCFEIELFSCIFPFRLNNQLTYNYWSKKPEVFNKTIKLKWKLLMSKIDYFILYFLLYLNQKKQISTEDETDTDIPNLNFMYDQFCFIISFWPWKQKIIADEKAFCI